MKKLIGFPVSKYYLCQQINTTSLNLPQYIARKISGHNKKSFSNFIIRLSTAATIISVAVMIVAMAIVQGFKDTIKDKAFEFWGHFHITQSSPNNDLMIGTQSIHLEPNKIQAIASLPEVNAIQPYVLGAGMLSTQDYNEGIRIKGVAPEYFKGSIDNVITYEGAINYSDSNYSTDVLLSKTILDKINKKIGDELRLYVLDQNEASPRVRKVHIAGTYHMGIEEIDNNFILCDLRLLQKLYQNSPEEVTGYQVTVKNYKHADKIADAIYYQYLTSPESIVYIADIYSEIFQWLELQDVNAQIILIIMAIVAIINMITALLTYILERVNMIGILKALGMTNWNIRKIFVYHFGKIIGLGIIGGVLLGLALCAIQYYFKVLKIDESIYYMQYVPIRVLFWHPIVIILGTFILSLTIMILPTLLIKKVNIVQAIKYK